MIYHVTCNTDDNYAQHCCAMLCSLFENNNDIEFHVHILTHNLTDDNREDISLLCKHYQCQFTLYEVDETRLEGVKFRKNRPLTKAAYYRILLPEVLDESIEKVLYLDCDMIVLGNVKELFQMELDGYALAATKDIFHSDLHRRQLHASLDQKAFSSGIMIINLKYWRENNATDRLLEYSKRDRKQVILHDQDALNYVFRSQWLLLPPKWNKHSLSYLPEIKDLNTYDIYEYVYQPKIIHFSSDAKPWFKIKMPYSSQYRRYLSKSGFKNPNFIRIKWKQRTNFEIMNFRYYTRKYVVPFIPSFIVIVLSDIVKILKLIIFIPQKNKLKKFILNEGVKASKNNNNLSDV